MTPPNFMVIGLQIGKFHGGGGRFCTPWPCQILKSPGSAPHAYFISYFRLRLGRKKSRKSKLLCFSSDLLEIWYRGNFEVLIIKRRPKLKLENDLSKKLQFSTNFSQNYTKRSSIIALPWRLWMPHRTGLYSK